MLVLHKVVQVRLYPSVEQQIQLAQTFGCARWWWNYALNKSTLTYKETGKGLSRVALNALLPALKKAEETVWLADCYSQVLQATTLDISEKCPCLSLTAFQEAITRLQTQPVSTQKLGFEIVCVDKKVKLSMCTSYFYQGYCAILSW
jgi:hypothetical protein